MVAAVGFALASSASFANVVWIWSASMSGDQEVPPNNSPAVGSAVGTFDPNTRDFVVEAMNVSGMVGTLSVSHIHRAPAGSSGPVIVDFGPVGTWSGNQALYTYNQTSQILFPAGEVANLTAGNTYINVHSSVFGGGEVRGQIILGGVRAVPDAVAVVRGVIVGNNDPGLVHKDDDAYYVVQQRFQASPTLANAEINARFATPGNLGATAGLLVVRVKANSLPFGDNSCRQEVALRDWGTGRLEVVDTRKPENPTSGEAEVVVGLDPADIAQYVDSNGNVEVAVRVFHLAPVLPAWTMSTDQIQLTLLR